jgi:hypothetical protein
MYLHVQLTYREAPGLQVSVNTVLIIRVSVVYSVPSVGQLGANCLVGSQSDSLVAPMSATMASLEIA